MQLITLAILGIQQIYQVIVIALHSTDLFHGDSQWQVILH